MLLALFIMWSFSIGMLVLGAGGIYAQIFPSKPIRIVTTAVGGANDLLSRIVAQEISGPLGQQVIVENRPSGVIPGEIVSKAPADGYVLLFSGSSLWILPLMQSKIPYDPVKDFSPITFVSSAPSILLVHPSVPVKSVKELIALAKANPRALNYSSVGAGATSHLSAELFKSMTGVDIVRIPYASNNALITDLISGQTQLTFGLISLFMPHVKSGKLRALAVSSAQPSALFPGLPPIAATVPGYESVSMQGMFAPAKTPTAVINRLNQELVRVLNRADVKERFLGIGLEAAPSSPDQFETAIKSEMVLVGKVIRDARITAD